MSLNPLERVAHFFDSTIWEDERTLSSWRRLVYPVLRIASLVYSNFQAHASPTHAAALTYTSLLSLIPLIAVAFAVFQGFGGLSTIEVKLQSILVQYLAPGMEKWAAETLETTMANIRTGARANAAVAAVLLFVTVIRTLSGLEWTFNTIVGVKKGRSWTARIVVYWAVVTLGPVLVGASLGMSASVQSSSIVQWLEARTPFAEFAYRLTPVLLQSLAIALLYLFLPNAKMKPRAALLGGLFAGVAFELAKRAMTAVSASMVQSQSEVYGTIATLFVFLFWIYLSWMIVLIGLEIVVAMQSATTHRKEELALSVSEKFREMVALRLVTELSERFDAGVDPPTVESLSKAIDVPERLLLDVLDVLEEDGLVRRVDDPEGQGAYVPGMPLERISVDDVLRSLRDAGTKGLTVKADEESRYLTQVIEASDEAAARVCGEETMRRIVDRLIETRPEPTVGGSPTPRDARRRRRPSVPVPAAAVAAAGTSDTSAAPGDAPSAPAV